MQLQIFTNFYVLFREIFTLFLVSHTVL